MSDKQLFVKIKNCINYWFIQSVEEFRIPLYETELLHSSTLLNTKVVSILPNLKQLIHYNKKFFRYDLSLGLLKLNIPSRAEIGYVYRHNPTGPYRWRIFEQADIDLEYSQDNFKKFLAVYLQTVRKLLPAATFVFNDVAIFQKVMNVEGYDARILKNQIDKGEKTISELEKQSIITAVSKEYGPAVNGVIDPTLVRGMHMYENFVFELIVPGMNVSFGGGGVFTMGKKYIGGSIGVSRIAKYIKDHKEYYLVLFFDEYLSKFKQPLKKYFIYTIFRQIKQNIKYELVSCLKNKIFKLIIIGLKEYETNKFSCKNLSKRTIVNYELHDNVIREEKANI